MALCEPIYSSTWETFLKLHLYSHKSHKWIYFSQSLLCNFSDPRQHHLLSGLLSSAMNWGSFLQFRFGNLDMYGGILKYICCLPLFKPVLIKNWKIKMYDEETTNFYKKGRHWKSKKIGESQLASVGREECWPEISWFSSFHCKSPPPNPPPERLMSIRSQHWHTSKCLATGFPGKWINQTNKNTDLYCFLIIMKQIHYGQFQITNVRSLGADIRRNIHSQYRWCNP